MKPIRDIRFFKSVIPNTDGHSLPSGMNNPSLTVSARRIALSLREHGFSLGDFDHLYINLTTCPVQDGMALAGRSKDPYHPWYRYYDMSVTPEVYGELEELSDATELISRLTRLLVEHFATDDFGEEKITAAVRQALDEGADMRIFYKEKKTATRMLPPDKKTSWGKRERYSFGYAVFSFQPLAVIFEMSRTPMPL